MDAGAIAGCCCVGWGLVHDGGRLPAACACWSASPQGPTMREETDKSSLRSLIPRRGTASWLQGIHGSRCAAKAWARAREKRWNRRGGTFRGKVGKGRMNPAWDGARKLPAKQIAHPTHVGRSFGRLLGAWAPLAGHWGKPDPCGRPKYSAAKPIPRHATPPRPPAKHGPPPHGAGHMALAWASLQAQGRLLRFWLAPTGSQI